MASDPTPVAIDSTAVEPEERVLLFTIDDEEYTIPRKIRPSVAMQYFSDVRERGPEVAMAEALAEIIGEDAMDALATCDAVTDEQMQTIMTGVQNLLMGTMNRVSGKSRAARRR